MSTLAVPVLREVRLYGGLGREFGRVFRLAVATPGEAARALCAVLPGFSRAFFGRDGLARYHVFVGRGAGRRDIGEADRDAPVGALEPIRIVPVIEGAKRGGALQIILGAALLFFAPYAAGALFGAGASVGLAVGVSVYGTQLGLSLVLGGVISLLSPQPARTGGTADNKPSYAFDGAVNTAEQGGPVPVVMGRVICGSTLVSQGLSTTQLVATGSYGPGNPAAPPLPALPPYEPDYSPIA